MAGLLDFLKKPEPQGILAEQPSSLLGALYANPLMQRQVAAQRAANPRPDVTQGLAGLFLRPELLAEKYDPMAHLNGMAGTVNQLFHKFGTPENPMGPFGLAGLTVFHGSPHKFDKFDMSKVGTGEGAQSYGHGLYFAENPRVAKGYRSNLTDAHPNTAARIDLREELSSLLSKERQARSAGKHQVADDFLAQASKLDEQLRAIQKPGALYKVELPDDQIAKMLDWDKPLSQQPEGVKVAMEKLGVSGMDGLKGIAQTPEGAAKLRSVGIPGIKYLDQGSRGAGHGSYNFVVFDDSLPKISGRE